MRAGTSQASDKQVSVEFLFRLNVDIVHWHYYLVSFFNNFLLYCIIFLLYCIIFVLIIQYVINLVVSSLQLRNF